MSTYVIYSPNTLEIYDTATNSGAAHILLNWYLQRVARAEVEQTDLSLEEWKVWKTLQKE